MTLEDDFILEEYRYLIQLRDKGNDHTIEFTKIYLTIIGGIIAVISFTVNFKNNNLVFCVLSFFAFLVGYFTYSYIIDHHISTTKNTHKLNRIRKEIIQKNPKMLDYHQLPVDPSRPKYGTIGFEKKSIFVAGYTGIIVLLLTGCLFFFLHFFIKIITPQSSICSNEVFWSFILPGFCSLIGIFVQILSTLMKFKKLNDDLRETDKIIVDNKKYFTDNNLKLI